MGGMVLWDVGLAEIFGLRNYLPWLITVQIANSFVSWVLFRYMVRVGLGFLTAAIVAPFFMVWASLNTVAYWAPEAIFTISLACVIVHFYCFVLRGPSNKALIVGTSTALVGILIHSICAVLIPISLVVLLIRRKWSLNLIASIPLLMYILWYFTYRKLPQANRWATASTQEIHQVRTAKLFFTSTWQILSRTLWLRSSPSLACVFVALVLIGFYRCYKQGGERRLIAISAVIASTIFLAGIAWSRAYFLNVMHQDPPGRYVAVIFIFLAPLAILPISSSARKISLLLHAPKKLFYFAAIALVSCATIANFSLRLSSDRNFLRYSDGTLAQIQKVAEDPSLDSYDPKEFVFGDNPWIDLTYGDVTRFVRLGWL